MLPHSRLNKFLTPNTILGVEMFVKGTFVQGDIYPGRHLSKGCVSKVTFAQGVNCLRRHLSKV